MIKVVRNEGGLFSDSVIFEALDDLSVFPGGFIHFSPELWKKGVRRCISVEKKWYLQAGDVLALDYFSHIVRGRKMG